MAVLSVGDRLALQLRDEKPEIRNPGQWGLFSGHVEPGEDPTAAMRRELWEELRLEVEPRHLFDLREQGAHVHAFHADVTGTWASHELREGQRAELFVPDGMPQPLAPLSAAVLERWIP